MKERMQECHKSRIKQNQEYVQLSLIMIYLRYFLLISFVYKIKTTKTIRKHPRQEVERANCYIFRRLFSKNKKNDEDFVKNYVIITS